MLAFHARRTPHAVAAVHRGQEIDYAQADRAVRQLMQALGQITPCAGRTVGLACSDPFWHVLMLFALEALGAAVFPFVQPIDAALEATLKHCDVLFATEPIEPALAPAVHLSPLWIEGVLAQGPPLSFTDLRQLSLDQPAGRAAYLLTTSGSTGRAKRMLLDWRTLVQRDLERQWLARLSKDARLLVAMPMSVGWIYYTVRACIRVCGTLVFHGREPLHTVLDRVTHVTLLPSHLRALLERLPADYRPRQALEVYCSGARLAPRLRQRVAERLHARVEDWYGSNETGALAIVAADGWADLLPGVELQVVDDADHVLACGEPGRLRVRSANMVQGYMDQEKDAGQFRQGWFYSGDLGLLAASGRLQLLGRADAMLNLGGIKVSPEEIEDQLAQAHLADDLAVCSLPDADGIEEVYLVLQQARVGQEHISSTLRHQLSAQFGVVRVLGMELIPRGPGGKIQRAQLRSAVAALAQA